MDYTTRKCLLLLALLAKFCLSKAFDAAIINSTDFNNGIEPESTFRTNENSSSGSRTRGMRDTRNADFVLGGLFPVHSDIAGGFCGELRRPGGLDRVEAMLFALDIINSSPYLLPRITLGYDIRDTCFVEQIGLDEAADLILSGARTGVETACATNDPTNDPSSETSTANETKPHTIGIVGAGSSPVSIPIAGLSRLFGNSQISYSSTSAILSNRERYPYFFRTVPSDTMEVRAILSLIQHFGWNFISTIFSRNSYGQSGIDDLHMLAGQKGICIDFEEGIEEAFSDSDYRRLVKRLLDSTANVVVLYATQQHVQNLFGQLANVSTERHFTWIATSGWAQLAKELPLQPVSGLFGTIPSFNRQSHFQDYYSRLTPSTNPRNPWLPEYFQKVVNCTRECVNRTSSPLADSEQEYSIPLVIDAVYAYAYALERYLNDSCESPVVWNRTGSRCNGQKNPINSSGLLQYIKEVDFISPTGNRVMFDSKGGVQALYEIVNFQVQTDSQNKLCYNISNIGVWSTPTNSSTGFIQITGSPQYGIDASGNLISGPVRSECGVCAPGQYRREVEDSCCGLCEHCLAELFSNSSRATQCSNCSMYGEMWGDNSTQGSTGCIEIPKLYLRFSHPLAIIVSIGSITGLLLLAAASVLLGIYWKTPVMMASSRESVILVLIGAGFSFCASFIYLSPPSLTICTLQRILLWFCFSLMYGALLVKVIRIARIFVLQKSSMTKLYCVKTYHQVLFSLLIVAGQMFIILLSLIIVNPAVSRQLQLNSVNPDALPEIVVTCEPEPLLSLVVSVLYEAGLILITVVLGTMTFKSPANFNESKAICVSSYILLCIWTMFFVTYIFTESIQHLQNAFTALTNTLGAYAILGSIIGPRLFISIFWKERNSKHFSRRATDGDVSVSKDAFSTISMHLSNDNLNTTATVIPVHITGTRDADSEHEVPNDNGNGVAVHTYPVTDSS